MSQSSKEQYHYNLGLESAQPFGSFSNRSCVLVLRSDRLFVEIYLGSSLLILRKYKSQRRKAN